MIEPIQRTRWLNTLILLLIVIASAVVVQMLWGVLSQFTEIILLLILAWLLAFMLGPIIKRIDGRPLFAGIVSLGGRLFGAKFAGNLERFRFTRLFAVAIVFVTLALLLMAVLAVLIPPLQQQLQQLINEYPDFAKRVSDATPILLQRLADVGIRDSDIRTALSGVLGSLQNVAPLALQNAIVFVGGIVTIVGDLGIVLFLSFFFALDGPRVFRQALRLVPQKYEDDVKMLANTIDRTFGAYVRVTILQAFLIAVGTAIVMGIFGEPYVLVASLLAGFFMLIPFVGTVLALVPPLLATLSNNPTQALLVVIILLVYQLLLVNVIMPKLMSDALGLHPVLVILSLLIGVKIAGFWGAFLAVPVAGVIVTMTVFLYNRLVQSNSPSDEDRAAAGQPAPPSAPTSADESSPTNVTPVE